MRIMSPAGLVTNVTYKLDSIKSNKMLGTVIVPWYWEKEIDQYGSVAVVYIDNTLPPAWAIEDCSIPLTLGLKRGLLCHSHWHFDSLMLYGLTLEEFEQVPGCAFSPSAAYLRSIME